MIRPRRLIRSRRGLDASRRARHDNRDACSNDFQLNRLGNSSTSSALGLARNNLLWKRVDDSHGHCMVDLFRAGPGIRPDMLSKGGGPLGKFLIGGSGRKSWMVARRPRLRHRDCSLECAASRWYLRGEPSIAALRRGGRRPPGAPVIVMSRSWRRARGAAEDGRPMAKPMSNGARPGCRC